MSEPTIEHKAEMLKDALQEQGEIIVILNCLLEELAMHTVLPKEAIERAMEKAKRINKNVETKEDLPESQESPTIATDCTEAPSDIEIPANA